MKINYIVRLYWSWLYRRYYHARLHWKGKVGVYCVVYQLLFINKCNGLVLVEKCPCIPHLLRTLVLIIQHVTENDVACLSASEMRLKLLIRVFRLSLAILKARCEPWLTFINSQSEVNRLFTILTAISEVAIPKAFSHHILGNYF